MWLMTVISFFNAAGFSVSLPFLSLYLYQQRGLSMTVVGGAILVSGLCSAGGQIFAGMLADRLGRRPLMLGTIAVTVVAYAAMSVLIAVKAPVIAIIAALTVMRIVLAMLRPAMTSVVVDVTPKDRLTESFGLLRVGQNVGWAAGPAAGGLLAAAFSYSWLFALAAAITGVTLVVVFLFFRETMKAAPDDDSARPMFKVPVDRRFLVFIGLALPVFVVMGQLVSTLSVFTVDRAGLTTTQFGVLVALNGTIVVFAQYPVARLVRKVYKPALLVVGAILYGLGYLTMGWVGPFSLAIVSIVVVTTGEMIYSPTTLAVAGELSPPGLRGHYLGYYGLSETLGTSLGPMLGGFLLDRFTTSSVAVWGIISSLAFLAALGYWRWARSYRIAANKGQELGNS